MHNWYAQTHTHIYTKRGTLKHHAAHDNAQLQPQQASSWRQAQTTIQFLGAQKPNCAKAHKQPAHPAKHSKAKHTTTVASHSIPRQAICAAHTTAGPSSNRGTHKDRIELLPAAHCHCNKGGSSPSTSQLGTLLLPLYSFITSTITASPSLVYVECCPQQCCRLLGLGWWPVHAHHHGVIALIGLQGDLIVVVVVICVVTSDSSKVQRVKLVSCLLKRACRATQGTSGHVDTITEQSTPHSLCRYFVTKRVVSKQSALCQGPPMPHPRLNPNCN